jgi:hypothetical protein
MNDAVRNVLDKKASIVGRLVPIEKLAGKIKLSVDRIRDLADAGYIPHWRVDGGEPLFDVAEVRRWVNDNLVSYNPGKPLPTHFCLTTDMEQPCSGERLPVELRNIHGLMDVTGVLSLHSGIYFLCLENQVVYVGQSKQASSRISQHMNSKEFDRILFLRWPAFDLDRAEGAIIRLLRPRLNASGKQHRVCAPGRPHDDTALLAEISVSELPN